MEPPSRAYLKLWELFIRIQKFPKQNEKCLDIAASPGGWTWVLQKIGAYVVAIDKSEVFIDKSNGEYIKKDIFKLEPRDFLGFDWMFCDVICYPEKLYEYIKKWVEEELNVPCVPEYRIFRNAHHYIIQLTQTDSKEVKFNFIEREKLINF